MRPFLYGLGGLALGAAAAVTAFSVAGHREILPAALSSLAERLAGHHADPAHSHDDHAARSRAGHNDSGAHHHGASDEGQSETRLSLSDAQIEASGIRLAPAAGGLLRRHFLASGSIAPDADRIARVAVRLVGTVAELRKGLGARVEAGEVVAIVESREVADAKSEYLAARITNELQQTLLGRLQRLLDTRATAENDVLRARLTAQEAQIRLDGARQKLFALGLSDAEIAALPNEAVESLRRLALRSPIRGRIAERRVDLGALVGREGQESELFVIVDLDTVWVDLAVAPADLARVKDGALVTIMAAADRKAATARITFVSPLLDRETRAARVVASLDNPGHVWRPGTFVTAEVPTDDAPAAVLVPKAALQSIGRQTVVFVRANEVFEARAVAVGREDDDQVEILGGLAAGEHIAVANSFILKAELGKSEAAHAH